jgi:signal transduction histidine kinase
VGELAASISDALNNPLANVSLRVESVLARTPADEPRHRALEIVDQEVKKGIGLGLAICRRVIQEHLGTVQIVSEVGKGTTVRIVLPLKNGDVERVRGALASWSDQGKEAKEGMNHGRSEARAATLRGR